MYQRSLRIADRSLTETLCGLYLPASEFLSFFQWGEDVTKLFFLLFLVVKGLTVDFDKTIELDDLTLGDKQFVRTADSDIDSCLLNLCVCHLTGNSTFPDKVIEFLLLNSTFYFRLVHIGRTDCLVSLLGTFGIGTVLA